MTSPADFIDQALLSLSAEPRTDHAGLVDLGRNELVHPALAPLLAGALRAVAESIDGRYYPQDEDLARIAAALGYRPEQLALCPGSDHAIGTLVDALTRVHPRALLQDPTYPSYEHFAQLYGVSLSRWLPRPGKFRYATEDATRAMRKLAPSLVIITDPHGMLGARFSDQEIAGLSSAAQTNGHLLVVDQCYSAFAASPAHNAWPADPHVVVLGSLSKSSGLAGLRLGYIAAHQEIIGYLRRWRHTNTVSQATAKTAAHLLEHHAADLAAIRADVIAGRDWLSDQVTAHTPWRALPSHANFLTVDVGDSDQAASLADALRTGGILVRHHHTSPAFSSLIQITAAPVAVLRPLVDQLAAFAHARTAS